MRTFFRKANFTRRRILPIWFERNISSERCLRRARAETSSEKDEQNVSYSHSLGHARGDEEDEETTKNRAISNSTHRYSDEDEEEYIRSISPREATKTATVNTEEKEEKEEEKEERQHDAVVSIRTTAAYREETSCVVALAKGRSAQLSLLTRGRKRNHHGSNLAC